MTTCTARRHDTDSARRRHGCTCPAALEAYRARNRRDYQRRPVVRGCRDNARAPRVGLDEVVVDRAVDGLRPRMTLPELHAAIDRLDARGDSAREIALRLGVTTRTVTRQRTRRRATSTVEAR